MNIYKFLNSDSSCISTELNQYITDYTQYRIGFNPISIDDLFLNVPSLATWLKTMNCSPSIAFMIRTPHGSNKENAHVDNWVEPSMVERQNSEYALAINFPIKNTERVTTSFYEYIDGPIKSMELHGYIRYKYYGNANLREICSYSLTSPVILNVTIPHSVINNSGEDRFALTFRFKHDPWHLLND
jgi:hypothetical protein